MQSPINQFYNPLQPDMNNLFNDPVASMAVKYGSSLAGQGKEYVAQNVCIFYHLNHSILLDCVQNFEFLGWQMVFGVQAKILFCSWHILCGKEAFYLVISIFKQSIFQIKVYRNNLNLNLIYNK